MYMLYNINFHIYNMNLFSQSNDALNQNLIIKF